MSIIKLKSSDDQIFNVDMKVAQQSVTIKTMLEDLGFTEDEEDEPIPLPNVHSLALKKVLEWASYHRDDPPYQEDDDGEKRTDDICDWDQQFFKIEHRELFDIILAANYLDIKRLLDIGCKTVANMIKGKSPDEIRQTFKIEKDSNPAEDKSTSLDDDINMK